jgi:hypothetical protein
MLGAGIAIGGGAIASSAIGAWTGIGIDIGGGGGGGAFFGRASGVDVATAGGNFSQPENNDGRSDGRGR